MLKGSTKQAAAKVIHAAKKLTVHNYVVHMSAYQSSFGSGGCFQLIDGNDETPGSCQPPPTLDGLHDQLTN